MTMIFLSSKINIEKSICCTLSFSFSLISLYLCDERKQMRESVCFHVANSIQVSCFFSSTITSQKKMVNKRTSNANQISSSFFVFGFFFVVVGINENGYQVNFRFQEKFILATILLI